METRVSISARGIELALNSMGLGFIFTAQNLASGTMTRLRGQLNGLGTQSKLTGIAMKAGFAIAAGGIANLLVGIGLLGTAFSLATAAGNFEQQMSLVGALANATGDRLENLRNAAIEAGLATKFSPDEAVEGLRNLITAGLQAEQAAEALTPALQVATFGMISVADAGAAVVGSMNAFRRQGLSAQQIADRLATAMARTNFQAQDFDVGLAAVAGTAGLFNQTLDTTLVGLGLLRNMNIGASRAATGLREAIRRLASDQRSQAEAQKLIGQEGLFREDGSGINNILEIMESLRVATQDLDAAQRDQALANILGARGIQTFAAVVGAEFRKEMGDGTTQILRGIDAVRELERQMRESSGMADMLQRAVSEGNFAGVVDVLKGVGQTLLVELGRPIAEVLIPVIVLLRDALGALTRFVNRLPLSFKKFGAAGLLLTGVMFTAAGIIGILVGLIIILIPFIKAIAIGFVIATAVMAPFIAAVGAVIGAIILLRKAVILNVGGVATFLRNFVDKIKLGFEALKQLFTQGGFSGAIRDEMNRAENQGIRRFVISVFRIWGRIQEFIRGFKIGFSQAVRALAPAFEGLVAAFRELGRALGFVDSGIGDLAGSNMDTWAEIGARAGTILADVLNFIVTGVRRVASGAAVMIDFFKMMWPQIAPTFEQLGEVITSLATEFEALFTELGLFTNDSKGNVASFGEGFAVVLRGIVTGIVFVIRTGLQLTRAFIWVARSILKAGAIVGDFFTRVGIRIKTTFMNIVDSIKSAIDRLIAFVGGVAGRIPAGFRPESLDDVVRMGTEAEGRIATRARGVAARNEATKAALGPEGAGRARVRAFEAAAEARARSRDRQIDAVLEAVRTERARDRDEATRPINLSIDGEIVARHIAGANRREGARGFVPTPADAT